MFSYSKPFYKHKKINSRITPAELIRQQGWTYQKASEFFDVDKTTIYRWLSGKIVKIAEKHYRKVEEFTFNKR